MPSNSECSRPRRGWSLLVMLATLAILSMGLIPLAGILMKSDATTQPAETPGPSIEETLLEKIRDELRSQPCKAFQDLSSSPHEGNTIEVPATLYPSTQESLKEVNAGSFDLYRLKVLILPAFTTADEIRLRATISRQDAAGEHFQNSEFTIATPR